MVLGVNNSELDEGSNNLNANHSVIEIPSSNDYESGKEEKKAVKKKKKDMPLGMVMTKAYRHAEPLEDVWRLRSTTATQALDWITSMFDPTTMRERDESRMAQQVQLNHLSAFQQEIRELCSRNA